MSERADILADLKAEQERRTTYRRQRATVLDTTAATSKWKRARTAELDTLIERSDLTIEILLEMLWDEIKPKPTNVYIVGEHGPEIWLGGGAA